MCAPLIKERPESLFNCNVFFIKTEPFLCTAVRNRKYRAVYFSERDRVFYFERQESVLCALCCSNSHVFNPSVWGRICNSFFLYEIEIFSELKTLSVSEFSNFFFSVLRKAVLLFWNSENSNMVSELVQAIWRSNKLKERSSLLQQLL